MDVYVAIYSDNWSDHIHQIKCFFRIMPEAKLTTNLMKSEFGKATVKYLGQIVGQGQVRPKKFKPLLSSLSPGKERTC